MISGNQDILLKNYEQYCAFIIKKIIQQLRQKMFKLTRLVIQKFSYNLRSPFDLKLFRTQQSLNSIKKSLEARFRDPKIADNVSQMLETYKKNLYDLEQMNKSVNSLQKQIKAFHKGKQTQNKEENSEQKKKIQQINELKLTQKQKQADIKSFVKNIQSQILKIGNIVDGKTPVFKDEAKNQLINQFKPDSGLMQHDVSYSDICQKFGLTDLKRGQKVGGHRGYFLKGPAVKLALALANYGLNFLQKKGYLIYHSPAIINQSTLKGSCQLQSIEQDVYKLQGLDSYLIATSQQSLAGYYKDEVLMKNRIPVRMAGYSTCFRKQAGAHGKDIHGLFRVHQFQKVEQFTIVQPEQSTKQMQRMMKISQQFYQSLGLPYRVVNIVSGQLNDAASCKYDLQAWFPAQKRYRQLVSVSNCTEYQSRLLKIQYQSNNETKFPHMLNGTLVAIQRTLTCIIQNNYHQDHIKIPAPLQPFTGIERIQLPRKQK